ncbi:MAG: PocR ligand-binding domain-containing protein [Treponema sp.]|jgi:two-component system response regulator YesN|nr:PocR ligand-binding domain-containing protein [Treponema sp.]
MIRLEEIVNLGELDKLLGYFAAVTGLDAALCDFSGKVIIRRRAARTGGALEAARQSAEETAAGETFPASSGSGLSICGLAAGSTLCGEHLASGGVKSMELGEPYIYACGCGLVMCSSPIVFNEELAGSIACGPVMLWDADELAVEEISKKTAGIHLQINDDLLRGIPSCGCVNITGAAQILFIIVNSLCREHSAYLRQREQITRQQAAIAELIIEQKAAELGERKNPGGALAYPAEKEKELIAFVQLGKKREATVLLNDILSAIFSHAGGDLDTIRVKLFELVAFLSRAAVDAGAPLKEVNTITRSAFEICEDDTDFERLCFLTTRAMEGFIETVHRNRRQKQTSVHMTRAIEYIRTRYMEDLSLGTVADAIYVSEYYLSHLFRREMNQTFSDYVARVRIEKARELLRDNPHAQIQEIADKTGFADPNYFAKIFKKDTGASPREYHGFFK